MKKKELKFQLWRQLFATMSLTILTRRKNDLKVHALVANQKKENLKNVNWSFKNEF